jgi:hypothetical protein
MAMLAEQNDAVEENHRHAKWSLRLSDSLALPDDSQIQKANKQQFPL